MTQDKRSQDPAAAGANFRRLAQEVEQYAAAGTRGGPDVGRLQPWLQPAPGTAAAAEAATLVAGARQPSTHLQACTHACLSELAADVTGGKTPHGRTACYPVATTDEKGAGDGCGG